MGWFIVGVAGILGALSRYGVSLLFPAHLVRVFPWETLCINLSGSLFLGWFLTFLLDRAHLPAAWRLSIGTGFTGSYTTFSTFAVETVTLLRSGHVTIALTYVLASFAGGWLCAWVGVQLAERVTRPA